MLPSIDTFYERLVYAKNTAEEKITWATLAKSVGIDKANFTRYKNNNYFPSPVTLLKISRVLNVDAAWLAGEEIALPEDGLDLLTNLFESLDSQAQNRLLEYAKTLSIKAEESSSSLKLP